MKISERDKSILKRHFPNMLNEEVAGLLGCSMSKMSRMARELKLHKDPDFRRAWYRQHLFELHMYNLHRDFKAQREARVGRTPANKVYEKPDLQLLAQRYHKDCTARQLAQEYDVPLYIMHNWLYEAGARKDVVVKKYQAQAIARMMGRRNGDLHTNNHMNKQ